jgi:NADPH-dependent glutamate synthase beta subunit-like oxidoreductase/coenzyme F420-reducing hydrogenase delta subunit
LSELLPPCTGACPVHTDVQGYLAAIARRDYPEAYRLIRANNPFPSVCAWICPHPCEDACRRAIVDEPLAIRDLKRFAVEAAAAPLEHVPVRDSGKRVAVVGAGPSGLTVAYDLARLGHRVVVYDRLPSPGGHFLTSLPAYRLPAEVLQRDIDEILAAGVEIRSGVDVGRDISVEQIRNTSDAVIISTGLWAGRGLKLPGFDHPAVLKALPFLKAARAPAKPAVGGRVIVIGGGDVALDAARTALRLGAGEVRVVCLETRDQMPAHAWELADAEAEGIVITAGCGPVELLLENGVITGMNVRKVLSLYDLEGNLDPVYDPGCPVTLPADTVILSVGQKQENDLLAEYFPEMQNGGLPAGAAAAGAGGVFLCGEIIDGPGPAISAIASGHRAAALVGSYLEGTGAAPVEEEAPVIGPVPDRVAEKIPRSARRKMPVLPPQERIQNFSPYELGLDEAAARFEAGRCLKCGQGAAVIAEKCAACLSCLRLCPYGVPLVDEQASIAVEGCQACGVCAAVCPAGAINMVRLDNEGFLSSLSTLPAGKDVVLFACQGTCIDRPELADLDNEPALGRVWVVEIPTIGALRLEWLLKAFESGAAGVAVVACGAGSCRYAEGSVSPEGIVLRASNMLQSIGIPPERLLYCRPDAGEGLAGLLKDFVRGL